MAKNGLIGKIRFESSMTEDEIRNEVRSVFAKPMCNSKTFRFKFLQPAGGSSKQLTVPAVSRNYKWTASAVAGKNKIPIYIMAEDDLWVC